MNCDNGWNFISIPKIMIINGSEYKEIKFLSDDEIYVEDTMQVRQLYANYTMGKKYKYNPNNASEDEFTIHKDILVLPTDLNTDRFVVKFDRKKYACKVIWECEFWGDENENKT